MLVDDSPVSSSIQFVLLLSENFGRHELLEAVCIKPGLLHRHSVLKRVKGKLYFQIQTETQTRQIQRHIDKETDRDIKM